MLRSQSSMRLPYCGGVHSMRPFSSSIRCRTPSTLMYQSSATRKISGVSQRQQCGYACTTVPASTSAPRSRRAATIGSAASAVVIPASHP